MRRNRMLALLAFSAVAVALAAPPAAPAARQKWYEKAVKKVEGAFTPAEAKPGQTVTFRLTIELNDGYFTYPTSQKDEMARSLINRIKFPDPGTVVFVGAVEDSKDAKTKADPQAGIAELRYYQGKAVFTRPAVVSPKAKPGPAAVKLADFKLSVCDAERCYLPKEVPVEATLKVLDGPAVPVEKPYADEVAKALAGK